MARSKELLPQGGDVSPRGGQQLTDTAAAPPSTHGYGDLVGVLPEPAKPPKPPTPQETEADRAASEFIEPLGPGLTSREPISTDFMPNHVVRAIRNAPDGDSPSLAPESAKEMPWFTMPRVGAGEFLKQWWRGARFKGVDKEHDLEGKGYEQLVYTKMRAYREELAAAHKRIQFGDYKKALAGYTDDQLSWELFGHALEPGTEEYVRREAEYIAEKIDAKLIKGEQDWEVFRSRLENLPGDSLWEKTKGAGVRTIASILDMPQYQQWVMFPMFGAPIEASTRFRERMAGKVWINPDGTVEVAEEAKPRWEAFLKAGLGTGTEAAIEIYAGDYTVQAAEKIGKPLLRTISPRAAHATARLMKRYTATKGQMLGKWAGPAKTLGKFTKLGDLPEELWEEYLQMGYAEPIINEQEPKHPDGTPLTLGERIGQGHSDFLYHLPELAGSLGFWVGGQALVANLGHQRLLYQRGKTSELRSADIGADLAWREAKKSAARENFRQQLIEEGHPETLVDSLIDTIVNEPDPLKRKQLTMEAFGRTFSKPGPPPAEKDWNPRLQLPYLEQHPEEYPTLTDRVNALHAIAVAHGADPIEAGKEIARLTRRDEQGVMALDAFFGGVRAISMETARQLGLENGEPAAEEDGEGEEDAPEPVRQEISALDRLMLLQALRDGVEGEIEALNAPTSDEGRYLALASVNNRGTRALVGEERTWQGERVTVLATHFDAEKNTKFAIVENGHGQLFKVFEKHLKAHKTPLAVPARQMNILMKDEEIARELGAEKWLRVLMATQSSGVLPKEERAFQQARIHSLLRLHPELESIFSEEETQTSPEAPAPKSASTPTKEPAASPGETIPEDTRNPVETVLSDTWQHMVPGAERTAEIRARRRAAIDLVSALVAGDKVMREGVTYSVVSNDKKAIQLERDRPEGEEQVPERLVLKPKQLAGELLEDDDQGWRKAAITAIANIPGQEAEAVAEEEVPGEEPAPETEEEELSDEELERQTAEAIDAGRETVESVPEPTTFKPGVKVRATPTAEGKKKGLRVVKGQYMNRLPEIGEAPAGHEILTDERGGKTSTVSDGDYTVERDISKTAGDDKPVETLLQAVKALGGIRAPKDGSEEYNRMMLGAKNKTGLKPDEMFEHIKSQYPYLIPDEWDYHSMMYDLEPTGRFRGKKKLTLEQHMKNKADLWDETEAEYKEWRKTAEQFDARDLEAGDKFTIMGEQYEVFEGETALQLKDGVAISIPYEQLTDPDADPDAMVVYMDKDSFEPHDEGDAEAGDDDGSDDGVDFPGDEAPPAEDEVPDPDEAPPEEPEPPEPPAPAGDTMTDLWNSLEDHSPELTVDRFSKKFLQARAEEAGVPTTGTKGKIAKRIHEKEQEYQPPEPPRDPELEAKLVKAGLSERVAMKMVGMKDIVLEGKPEEGGLGLHIPDGIRAIIVDHYETAVPGEPGEVTAAKEGTPTPDAGEDMRGQVSARAREIGIEKLREWAGNRDLGGYVLDVVENDWQKASNDVQRGRKTVEEYEKLLAEAIRLRVLTEAQVENFRRSLQRQAPVTLTDMARIVQLSDVQLAKLYRLAERAAELRQDDKSMRDAIDDIRIEIQSRHNEVLSPEQAREWVASQTEEPADTEAPAPEAPAGELFPEDDVASESPDADKPKIPEQAEPEDLLGALSPKAQSKARQEAAEKAAEGRMLSMLGVDQKDSAKRALHMGDVARIQQMTEAAQAELAKPVLDALKALAEDGIRTDPAGMPMRGGSEFIELFGDGNFTVDQLGAARAVLNRNNAHMTLLDEIDRAPGVAPADEQAPAEAEDAESEGLDALDDLVDDLPDIHETTVYHAGQGEAGKKKKGYKTFPGDARKALARMARMAIEQGGDARVNLMHMLAHQLGEDKAERLWPYADEIIEDGRALQRGGTPSYEDEESPDGTSKRQSGTRNYEKQQAARRRGRTESSGSPSELPRRAREQFIEALAPKHVSDSTLDIYVNGAMDVDMPLDKIKEFVSDIDLMVGNLAIARQLEPPRARAEGTTYPDRPRAFVLGNSAGTGKTFIIAAAIRELKEMHAKQGEEVRKVIVAGPFDSTAEADVAFTARQIPKKYRSTFMIERTKPNGGKQGYYIIRKVTPRKQPRVLWVTQSQNLVKQIQRDVEGRYGIKGIISYSTYSAMNTGEMKGEGKFQPADQYDLVIFDESQFIKNLAKNTSTARAGARISDRADMAIYSSATPFENPMQVAYLANTGIFDNEKVGFHGWVQNYGVSFRQKNTAVFSGKVKDCLACQAWLRDAGVMAARTAELPPGLVKANFGRIPLTQEQAEIINHIESNFAAAIDGIDRNPGAQTMMRMQETHMIRRALESFKIPMMLENMNEELKRGQKIIVMTAMKAKRDLEAKRAEIAEKVATEPSPFHIAYLEAHEGLDYVFESPIEAVENWAKERGLTAVTYTGDVSEDVREANLDAFRQNKAEVIVATMAAGGAGLSVHDTIGGHPISQFILTMPWTGTVLDQASHRAARYGMKSALDMFLLFTDDRVDLKLARLCGGRLRSMKALVSGVEYDATAEQMLSFDFELLNDAIVRADVERAEGALKDMEEGQVFKAGQQGQQPMAKLPAEIPGTDENAGGESKAGKKLISKIQNDKKGRVGVRSIVTYIMDSLGIELRVGREALSAKHPAHYEEAPHLVRAKSGHNVNWAAHEGGHGMMADALIEDEEWYRPIERDLLKLTDKEHYPDTMASGKNVHEGMAEWVRRAIFDTASIRAFPGNEHIVNVLNNLDPAYMEVIRDANRAYIAHMSRPFEIHTNADAKDIKQTQYPKDVNAFDKALFNAVSRGWPIEKNMRLLQKAMQQSAKNRKDGYQMARRFVNDITDSPADMQLSYDMMLRYPIEMENVMEGTGLRIFNLGRDFTKDEELLDLLEEVGFNIEWLRGKKKTGHGEVVQLTEKSVHDIIKMIPAKEWEFFELWGNQKSEMARWDARERQRDAARKAGAKRLPDKYQYPGIERTGPDEMKAQIAAREAKNPHWLDTYKEVENLYKQLLLVAVMSGEKDPAEAFKMVGYDLHELPDGSLRLTKKPGGFDSYWALMRHQEREQSPEEAGGMGTHPSSRFFRAWGSQLPVEPMLKTLYNRAANVLHAYYLNQTMLAPIRMARLIEHGLYPEEVKRIAHRIATRLPLEWTVAATLNNQDEASIRAEIARMLNEKWGTTEVPISQTTSGKVEGVDRAVTKYGKEERVTADDINLIFAGKKIWRRSSPTGINILAPVVDGKRVFYQVEDPLLFDIFSRTKDPNSLATFASNLLEPMTREWKKQMTQNIMFFVRNLPRDVAFAMLNAKHFEEWMPGYDHAYGIMATMLKKTKLGKKLGADVVDLMDAELLSKSHAMNVNPAEMARRGNFKRFLHDAARSPWNTDLHWSERWARGVPYALFKLPEFILWKTGQRGLSQWGEAIARKGAAAIDRRHGASAAAAVARGAEVTGKFAEHPANSSWHTMLRIGGFLNPRLQIARQIAEQATDPDPIVKGLFMLKLAWRTAWIAGMWALSRGMMSPEDREKEKNRPYKQKLRTANLFGWRVPFEFGMDSLVFNTLDTWLDKQNLTEEERHDLYWEMLKMSVDTPASPLALLGPWIMTLSELKIRGGGYSHFFGKDIEPWYMQGKAANVAVWETTPDAYKWLAEATAKEDGTGGWRPLKVDYAVRNLLGGVYNDMFRTIDYLRKGRLPKEAADWPFVGRIFVRDPKGFASRPVQNLRVLEKQYKELSAVMSAAEERGDFTERSRIARFRQRLDRAHFDVLYMSKLARQIRYNRAHLRWLEAHPETSEDEIVTTYQQIGWLEREMTAVAVDALDYHRREKE